MQELKQREAKSFSGMATEYLESLQCQGQLVCAPPYVVIFVIVERRFKCVCLYIYFLGGLFYLHVSMQTYLFVLRLRKIIPII